LVHTPSEPSGSLLCGGRGQDVGQHRRTGHMRAVTTRQLDHLGVQPVGGDPPWPGRLDDPVVGAHDRGARDRREHHQRASLLVQAFGIPGRPAARPAAPGGLGRAAPPPTACRRSDRPCCRARPRTRPLPVLPELPARQNRCVWPDVWLLIFACCCCRCSPPARTRRMANRSLTAHSSLSESPGSPGTGSTAA
jgi:hypothetical protein